MLEEIRLKNFRSHADIRFPFNDGFNLISGRNNAGKTTIFYAIEYCFFGNISGYKKISQLTAFDANDVGVEILFRGRTGEKYKLQRMHKISGKNRAAKGHFTLKKYIIDKEDPTVETESYLLSSDFGDREDKLSLTLSEITGISKRFFETAIHYRQGTVAEILDGSDKLDIVFGISAASALVDIFKSRALSFEKEAKEIESLQVNLNHNRKERGEINSKISDQESKIANFEEDVENKRTQQKVLVEIKSQVDNLSNSVQSFNETNNMVEQQNNLLANIKQEQIQQIKNFGKVEDLKLKQTKTKKEIKTQLTTISKTEKILIKEQENIRTLERDIGDINGILKRRSEASKEPTCENCGAPIDPEKIAEEIKEFTLKLEDLQTLIKEKEGIITKQNKLLNQTREKESKLKEKAITLESNLNQLTNLEEKLVMQKKEMALAQKELANKKKQLILLMTEIKKQMLVAVKQSSKQVADSEFTTAISALIKKMAFTSTSFSIDIATKITHELNELVITKTTEINTAIRMISDQLAEIETTIRESQNKILELDKEIAHIENSISGLNKKQILAKKYRNFGQIFDQVQTRIRENSASALEKKILDKHKFLSVDDEFTSVKIDPEDYSLAVNPIDAPLTEYYPANLYQGGGHKLILGLAYKLALGELIGPPPFVLLDEPTQSADRENRLNLLSKIQSVGDKSQVFLITHQDVNQLAVKQPIEITREKKNPIEEGEGAK